MFERLSESFSAALRKLAGKDQLSQANVAEAMQDVRRSLIEADVNQDVVDKFCADVVADSVGRDVTKSLNPGQEMVGIVFERLVALLGEMPAIPANATHEEVSRIMLAEGPGVLQVSPGPTIIMLCGLQGSGKTTTAGKLAGWLKKRGRSVMLVAADLQRPAAVEQLETVAQAVERDLAGGAQVHFYGESDKSAAYGKAVGVAVDVCRRGIAKARQMGVDTVILDTAGRLHVNDELMGEVKQVQAVTRPHQIFLVVDAMTGQDAVRSARAFHEKLNVDGLIMTKFDSDTRGGAALTAKTVTGAPIRFIGVGEKLENLEEFHAQRMAGRILGMGDVVSLVERAKEQVSEEDARKLEEKLAKGEMTMDDFLGQLKSLRRMGPLKQLLGMLPGVGGMLKDVHIDDKHLNRVEGIIHSMTREERASVKLLNNSRRRRIAKGSASSDAEVGQLVRQFETVSMLSKNMANMSALDKIKAVKQMGQQGGMSGMVPGLTGMPGFRTKGSSHTPGVKALFKKRKK
ncbi:MAG: signal recognition particle protein [Phycisphaerales bacterium]